MSDEFFLYPNQPSAVNIFFIFLLIFYLTVIIKNFINFKPMTLRNAYNNIGVPFHFLGNIAVTKLILIGMNSIEPIILDFNALNY